LSVIGFIGIILPDREIVKKNAIMMIDFALDAERRPGIGARARSIYQAALLRFRPIMMTTMAALLGAPSSNFSALALGRRLSSAAGHHDRRRVDALPAS